MKKEKEEQQRNKDIVNREAEAEIGAKKDLSMQCYYHNRQEPEYYYLNTLDSIRFHGCPPNPILLQR